MQVETCVWQIILTLYIGTGTSQGMSAVEEEMNVLSNQMRQLESQVSQQNRAGSQVSSSQLQRMENAIQKAEAELRRVQSRLQNIQDSGPRLDKLEGKVSTITNSEAKLEKRLLEEMKRIEAELRRLQNMYSNQNSGSGQNNGQLPSFDGDNDYDKDANYVPSHNSNSNGNTNNHAFDIPGLVFSSSDQQFDDIYEADRDYYSSSQTSADDGAEFEAVQAQVDTNTSQGKIIGIAFGSVFGLVLIVSVVFGCFINALLYLKRKNKGTTAESAILTS